jgi:hypothetical protein
MPAQNANKTIAKRVPIPMSADEVDALKHLAAKDSRSEAAMARIIYLEGLKQYESTSKSRLRR